MYSSTTGKQRLNKTILFHHITPLLPSCALLDLKWRMTLATSHWYYMSNTMSVWIMQFMIGQSSLVISLYFDSLVGLIQGSISCFLFIFIVYLYSTILYEELHPILNFPWCFSISKLNRSLKELFKVHLHFALICLDKWFNQKFNVFWRANCNNF